MNQNQNELLALLLQMHFDLMITCNYTPWEYAYAMHYKKNPQLRNTIHCIAQSSEETWQQYEANSHLMLTFTEIADRGARGWKKMRENEYMS